MTIRESIQRDLARIRREQLLAVALFFPAFAMLVYFQYESIPMIKLPAVMLLVALVLMAHAFMRVLRGIRCSACTKSLGHIMFNPRLTQSNYAVLVCPVRFPDAVTECPHCREPLDGPGAATSALKT